MSTNKGIENNDNFSKLLYYFCKNTYNCYSMMLLTFIQLKGTESLNDMIQLLTYSKEFEYITLRRSEKGILNILNKNKLPGTNTLRFPIEGGINTRETKINW